mmetsp:Transcript_73443/g.215394  ORF Transcript_73443/g.215394 Transcript_73443/m.215394 type:complete len:669 (-) Transcript_73443:94-2100(-)
MPPQVLLARTCDSSRITTESAPQAKGGMGHVASRTAGWGCHPFFNASHDACSISKNNPCDQDACRPWAGPSETSMPPAFDPAMSETEAVTPGDGMNVSVDAGGTEDAHHGDKHTDAPPEASGSLLSQFKAIFPIGKLVGLLLGGLFFMVVPLIELDDRNPKANDMLAVLGLVGCFWVFEVLPLPVTSLLPAVLMPFAGIMTSKAAALAYWSWVQMLFIGAFMVDIAIEHVSLHRRIALGFLLRVGVKHPWVVMIAFACISYSMSMWCTNTATTVMLTPFATGLLDTAQTSASANNKGMVQRYSVGVLLTIAYSSSCGGIATSIGTIPNGVLAGMPEVNDSVSAQDWFAFAFPISFLGVLVANTIVYFLFVRGVTLEMDKQALQAEYRALGRLNRDEIVVASVQLLQIFGWLSRKHLINGAGIEGVGDGTIACMAAALLFFIPSVKRPGQTVLTWDVAQAHLPWGVLLLMGGGFAIAKGFQSSNLTRYVGEKLAEASQGVSLFGLCYLITSAICFLTEVTSNTATANIMLPILASVATETLTHPLALMLPATVACSFAFMLPAATPPNSVVFATKRIKIKEFVQAGLAINSIMILLGAPLLYIMGSAIFDTTGPFPQWGCLPETCRWVNVPGIVAGDEMVHSQACMLLNDNSCRLYNGTVLQPSGVVRP